MIFTTETLTGVGQRPQYDGEAPGDTMAALTALLRGHAAREADALEAYDHLAAGGDSEGIRYLAGLIVEDERRHHRLIAEMLNWLRTCTDDVELEPRLPDRIRLDATSLEETQRLLAIERDDERALKRLRKELRHEPRSLLLPLLVDLIVLDTAKHIEILEFISAQDHR